MYIYPLRMRSFAQCPAVLLDSRQKRVGMTKTDEAKTQLSSLNEYNIIESNPPFSSICLGLP